MRKIVALVFVVTGLAWGTGLTAEQGPASAPTAEVKKAEAKKAEDDARACIDDGIKFLEAKDYVSAFKLMAGPVAEKTEQEGKLDHAVEVFKAGMGEELLKGLMAAKEGKATVDDDGQTVTFDVSDKYPDAPKMTFKKWGGKWYLD
jgi:hypothetical protein